MAATLPNHYSHPPPHHHQLPQQPSYYYDPSALYQEPPPPTHNFTPASGEPVDSITALNLRVLRRLLPLTTQILYQAQYAVIYTFTSSGAGWEKSGKEGTLFIVRENTQKANNHALVVLNRRGMDNFVMRDWDPQVQSEGGHIILRGKVEGEAVGDEASGGEGEDLTVWGLWIWEEKDLPSTMGKRAGVERCLIACAGGEAEGVAAETEGGDTDGRAFENGGQEAGEVAQPGPQHWAGHQRLPNQREYQMNDEHQPFMNGMPQVGQGLPGQQMMQQLQRQQQHHQHQESQHIFPQQQQHHHQQMQATQQQHYQQPPQPPQQLQFASQPSQQSSGQPVAQGPGSPNLMALLNGGAAGVGASQQAPNPDAGRDILGDLFRNAGR